MDSLNKGPKVEVIQESTLEDFKDSINKNLTFIHSIKDSKIIDIKPSLMTSTNGYIIYFCIIYYEIEDKPLLESGDNKCL